MAKRTGSDDRALRGDVGQVDTLTALDFAAAARKLNMAAQREGLQCPMFRSPPDLAGASRSLRRNVDGSVTVSVVVRGRFRMAVIADMIDGVVAANSLVAQEVSAIRDSLWQAAASDIVAPRIAVDLTAVESTAVDSAAIDLSAVESIAAVEQRPADSVTQGSSAPEVCLELPNAAAAA